MEISLNTSYTLTDSNRLPTHLAQVVGRVNAVGPNASADTFLYTSYVVECLIKSIAIALCAGLRNGSKDLTYKFEYDLVRADGLGNWESVINDCTKQGYAGYIDSELNALKDWLARKRTRHDDQWVRNAASQCSEILQLLGSPDSQVPDKINLPFLFNQFVRIRNKTKAHGAVGEDFFNQANSLYLSSTRLILENCPLSQWEWMFLAIRQAKGNVKALRLSGNAPSHYPESEAEAMRPSIEGIYFRTRTNGPKFHCGDLIRTSMECKSFYLPNGSMGKNGDVEFLDYASGKPDRVNISRLLTPPAPLPPSATEGGILDIYNNVIGTLPPPPSEYVERPNLQSELLERLQDKNHPIITLHGRGGSGKTSVALHVAHQLSNHETPLFDHILWFSARDLELKPSGSSEVRRAISNIETVCRHLSQCINISPTNDDFAKLLHDPAIIKSAGILFIFDNFETLDDPLGFHKFLDTHTHIPNKVLITSRERAFKGDFPIEVGGMELAEARLLLSQQATALKIRSLIDDDYIDEIINFTNGHAYVMRVLLGEVAKEKKRIPLKTLIPRRGDLLSVIFERSFNKLSSESKYLFLVISGWRSVISELALHVVVGRRDIDIEAALEECIRLSLVTRQLLPDGKYCYFVPELAIVFAKKKLEGDPDRLPILEDLELLREFGTMTINDIGRAKTQVSVNDFLRRMMSKSDQMNDEARNAVDGVLLRLAEEWPPAWLGLAEFRIKCGKNSDEISYALRRAVEERPYDKAAWLMRVEHAKKSGDESTRIASMVSAVEADPNDIELLREVALQLCKYVDAHKMDIPKTRRGVYLASVRSHMEKYADQFDATGLSRLAWLFLLEGDEKSAWKYANLGLASNPTNTHCLNIVENLDKVASSHSCLTLHVSNFMDPSLQESYPKSPPNLHPSIPTPR